jgi:phage terminase small subunit
MKRSKFKVPGHLRPETRKWFKGVLDSFELESHHLKLLLLAAESWDRIVQARLAIEKDGLFTTDRYGTLKPHPAVKIEIDNKVVFSRLIRELGFDLERPNENFRPPRQY